MENYVGAGGYGAYLSPAIKKTLHIATGEYCFAEIPFDGSAEEAVMEAKRLQQVANAPGLSEKDWHAVLDDLLDDQSIKGDPGIIEEMNPFQGWCINEVKKAYKRLTK